MQKKLFTETASVQRRIAGLKRLVREYYALPDKALIERHAELLRVFDVRGSKHKELHPHKKKRVYISRRSLKHVVESRKEDFRRKHSDRETLEKIDFLVDKIQETIIDFDIHTFEPPNYIYTKAYPALGVPFVRVIVESVGERLEIKSIQFNRSKRL